MKIPFKIKLFFSLCYSALLFYTLYEWLFYGRASVLSTICTYLTFLLIGMKAIDFVGKKKDNILNAKLLLVSLVFSFFVGDLALKYVFKRGLAYTELTGSFYYQSRYLTPINNFFPEHTSPQGDTKKAVHKLHKPNSSLLFSKNEFEYEHQYNQLGCREKKFSPQKKDSLSIRIMGLGDSFTEGVGTHQDSTWLKFMEQQLSSKYPEKSLEVLNCGCNGSDVILEYLKFKEVLLPYKPDMVLIGINHSDIDDIASRFEQKRIEDHDFTLLDAGPWWEYFFASSFMVRALTIKVLKYDWYFNSPKMQKIKYQQAKKDILATINYFYQLGLDNNFEIVVVFHPIYNEILEDDFYLADVVDKLPKDVNYINLYDSYLKSNVINKQNVLDYNWPLDCHPNAKGYQIMGQVIAEKLIENFPEHSFFSRKKEQSLIEPKVPK